MNIGKTKRRKSVLNPTMQFVVVYLCRAVAKETVRSPSLYWEWPRPALWPTNSLSNLKKKMHAVDRPASPFYYLHYFFWPLVATTGQTPGSVAFACWRFIRLLEYLDEAR